MADEREKSHLSTLRTSREDLDRAVANLPNVIAHLQRQLAVQVEVNARLDARIERNERKGRSGC
jgi:hypothetical protein